jgi:PAS domain S-box-containing protein
MEDQGKTREQLLAKLAALQRRLADLEAAEAGHKADRKLQGVSEYIRDISEQKKAENALARSRAEFQAIFNSIADGIVFADLDRRIVMVNPAAGAMFGYAPEEMLGRTTAFLYASPEDYEEQGRQRYHMGSQPAQQTFEVKYRRRDGSLFPCETMGTSVQDAQGHIIGFVAIHRDISQRKRSEEALRRSEATLRSFRQVAPIGIGLVQNRIFRWSNDYLADLTGYAEEELQGQSARLLYPDEAEYQRVGQLKYADIHQHGKGSIETRWLRKDGEIREILLSSSPLEATDLQTGVVFTALDITQRKRAEEALAAEKERLAVTLASIGDGVIATDIEGNVVLMNQVAESLTGWSRSEAVGRPLTRIFHLVNEKTREPCENPVEKVLQSGGLVGLANHTLLIHRDGSERLLADSGAPIVDQHGRIMGVVLVFKDITLQRQMESELQKMARLNSLGLLAGGIAHDFNNILTAILGNLSLAHLHLSDGENIMEYLLDAEKAASRARDLAQQLLTFAKGGAPVKELSQVSGFIVDAAQFATTGSNVLCRFSLPEDLWSLEVDPGQFSQVIQNIVLNAVQAMPTGGIIRIAGENAGVPPGSPLPLTSGHYVKLTIQDEGLGIPSDYLPKIFDPYFTTKQKGSGLGLATVYSIINHHQGYITVASQPTRGSTFTIYLPASLLQQAVKPAATQAVPTGQGRILFMDDEEMVRKVVARMLQSLGYEVDLAGDGEQALAMFAQAQTTSWPYTTVILDLTVPGGMGGAETLAQLKNLDPQVKVIVASGYSDNPILTKFRAHGFQGFIKKPFTVSEVAKVLTKVLKD